MTSLRRVPDTTTLFEGVNLVGASEVVVAGCDRLDTLNLGATPCRFDKVRLTIEVAPRGSGTLPSNFVVTEDVQLRNASF